MPALARSWVGSLLIATLAFLPVALPGQPVPESSMPAASADTTHAGNPAQTKLDGGSAAKLTPAPKDSLAGPKSRADTVLVVKHNFNHRQQIITGSVVMTCLALMMVVMNNYNPR